MLRYYDKITSFDFDIRFRNRLSYEKTVEKGINSVSLT